MEKQSFRDDEAVSSTNTDASECKRSAVRMGYYEDPFIGLFLTKTMEEPGYKFILIIYLNPYYHPCLNYSDGERNECQKSIEVTMLV